MLTKKCIYENESHSILMQRYGEILKYARKKAI